MRLLITTQAVDLDDPILGFFHGWVASFAKNCKTVHVICLREGRHELPSNVRVHSLGKPSFAKATKGKGSRIGSRMGYMWHFYHYIWSLRCEYDTVFVHMNPEYVVLGGILWRILGKRIGLWYVHKHVGLYLRIATGLSHIVFTASKESVRLKHSKIRVMGHGIDTAMFTPRMCGSSTLRIVTVGRVSPTKRVREMTAAIGELNHRKIPVEFSIIGAPVTANDIAYEKSLRKEVQESQMSNVRFIGPVLHRNLPDVFTHADLALNMSTTGSLDKALLEGFVAEVPAISSNEAFRAILEPVGLFIHTIDAVTLANAIEAFMHRPDRAEVGRTLRAYVEAHHSLSRLIPAIVSAY